MGGVRIYDRSLFIHCLTFSFRIGREIWDINSKGWFTGSMSVIKLVEKYFERLIMKVQIYGSIFHNEYTKSIDLVNVLQVLS